MNNPADRHRLRRSLVHFPIYKMQLDGTIVGKFGKAGKGLGEFSTVHAIDCRNPNELYVSEISAWRAQKIILNPTIRPPTAAR